MKAVVPLSVFVILAAFLTAGLGLDPHEIPSPLIDRAAPAFRLAELQNPDRGFTPGDMRGKVWLLNVWASWCVSCRAEHAVLTSLARTGSYPSTVSPTKTHGTMRSPFSARSAIPTR